MALAVIVRLIVAASSVVLDFSVFFFQAEDGIRDLVRSRGLGDVYKRQRPHRPVRSKNAGWRHNSHRTERRRDI